MPWRIRRREPIWPPEWHRPLVVWIFIGIMIFGFGVGFIWLLRLWK
jgi:hypothetical protein